MYAENNSSSNSMNSKRGNLEGVGIEFGYTTCNTCMSFVIVRGTLFFQRRQTIYRSGTVNLKSFVGKVLLRIKWKFELTYAL